MRVNRATIGFPKLYWRTWRKDGRNRDEILKFKGLSDSLVAQSGIDITEYRLPKDDFHFMCGMIPVRDRWTYSSSEFNFAWNGRPVYEEKAP